MSEKKKPIETLLKTLNEVEKNIPKTLKLKQVKYKETS